MTDVTVVSGTYNRLQHLQGMVNSARASVKYNLSLDFVLVDGGSTDGTIEWCKAEPDITLIEHSALLGAVKAFNDGAFAATGNYVILANDDIEFVEDSIYQSWLFMELHKDYGVGCFYQDRDKDPNDEHKWHVETMPVIMHGKQATAFYGQVCIVPKWLGDSVHWWCDPAQYISKAVQNQDTKINPLHTYGGDCELSSRVYELGYQVVPVPNAKIHDNRVEDGLRNINNIDGATDPKSVKGHHPDSWSWGRRWRNPKTEMVGPVIQFEPQVDNPMNYKPRTVYLPIYEPGWDIQKQQKKGLRQALEAVGLCIEYDYMGKYNQIGKDAMLSEIAAIMREVKPTLFLTQLHNGDILNAEDVESFRRFSKFAKFVNWNGDYWPDQCLNEAGIKLVLSFDLATSVNRDVVEGWLKQGVNADYWQIGYEPDGVVQQPTINHDVVFLASGYSEERQKLGRWLKGLRGISLGLYGNGWPNGYSKGENLYNFTEAAGIYMGAKISIGDSQWPDSGFVSNRVMQALAAGGSVLAHQWFRGMEHLGLIDGQTCIIWQDLTELERKIRQYLADEPLRAKVAENGQKLAFRKHSFEVRVRELFNILEPKQEESWRW